MFSVLENISCLIVAGGSGLGHNVETVEVIFRDRKTKQLPKLPKEIKNPSIVLQGGALLLCGGMNKPKKCFQLNHGEWKDHSTLNRGRYEHSVVTTRTATFLFGGQHSRKTYEYLPKGSTTWLMGKTKIPGGFDGGSAIAVKSDQEIWLIGGWDTEERILSFDVKEHTFQELPFPIRVGRRGHRCAFIPNTKKVMISGGDDDFFGTLKYTEIINTEDGSVTKLSPMNSKRFGHGIGVLRIKDEDRLAVFGGCDGDDRLDNVETYNSQTKKWEKSDIKLNEAKYHFGFLNLKLSDIISELNL